MRGGRGILIAGFALAILASPVRADGTDCAPGQIGCGSLRGLLGELMREVDPWLTELAEMLGDLSGWHAPELLPNGDILIRRRQPATTPAPSDEDEPPVTSPLEL